MTEPLFAESSCRARVAAALEEIDLTRWLFGLRDDEYRACSKAHIAAGASKTPDGRRLSINVENPGGTLLVQHYVEDLVTRARCRVVSDSDAFTPLGRSKYGVVWEVSVVAESPTACTFTNQVRVYATPHLLGLLRSHAVPLEQAAAAAQRIVEEHNAEETPLFAGNIEAKALAGLWRA